MVLRFAAAMIVLSGMMFSVAHADTPMTAQKVLQKLSGTWEIEDGVNQGEKLSEDELDGTTLFVKDKTIVTYDKDQKETYRATFTVDPTKQPMQIDMLTQMKGFPPAKAYGILKFSEEDELTICYALPGATRPTEFQSPKGSKIMLFECEKED